MVTNIPEGGLVPKSYYMSVEEFEKDQSPGPHLLEDSIYNSTARKISNIKTCSSLHSLKPSYKDSITTLYIFYMFVLFVVNEIRRFVAELILPGIVEDYFSDEK